MVDKKDKEAKEGEKTKKEAEKNEENNCSTYVAGNSPGFCSM